MPFLRHYRSISALAIAFGLVSTRKIQLLPPANLLGQVAAFIERHQMLDQSGRTVGVAVSGGADSVVLLHLLQQLRSQFACRLHVLHVNHHLRGAASDADEEFVRGLAAELGLPITIEQCPAPSTHIEQQARDLRRTFFRRTIHDHNLHAIALGHNRSDQAETVLFRLFRGSGLSGLAGMRPVTSDCLIRPLLTCTRDEIRVWAADQKIQWREDSSNLDTAFTRNRIRIETLPALTKTYNPNLEALLAQCAGLAQTEEDFWHHEIEALYPQLVIHSPRGPQISVKKLAPLHLALRRRFIRHAISILRGDLKAIDFDHVESILQLCESMEGHNRVIIPGVDALRSFDQLLLSPVHLRSTQERHYDLELKPGPELELPYQTGFLSVQSFNSGDAAIHCVNFKNGRLEKVETSDLDGDLLSPSGTLPSLFVRNWRPGDVFQRAGHHSAEKVKTLFQSGKVLLWERKHWPVVLAGNEIVWVRQFGASAKVSATERSSRLVRLVYRQA